MLLTQALQPLGCDDGPPAVKPPPKFDPGFNPKVCWSMLACMQQLIMVVSAMTTTTLSNCCSIDCVGISEYISCFSYTRVGISCSEL